MGWHHFMGHGRPRPINRISVFHYHQVHNNFSTVSNVSYAHPEEVDTRHNKWANRKLRNAISAWAWLNLNLPFQGFTMLFGCLQQSKSIWISAQLSRVTEAEMRANTRRVVIDLGVEVLFLSTPGLSRELRYCWVSQNVQSPDGHWGVMHFYKQRHGSELQNKHARACLSIACS